MGQVNWISAQSLLDRFFDFMHDWDRIKEFHRGIKEIPDDNGCTCIKINYYIGSVILCSNEINVFRFLPDINI